jgi:hypothetical protein
MKPAHRAAAAETKRQTAAVERITGEWYCPSASHYTKADATTWRGRRICVPCQTKLQAQRKKGNKP